MAIITLTFSTLNVSVQPTDVVYACLTVDDQAGINHPSTTVDTKPFPIGEVVSVNHKIGEIKVDDLDGTEPLPHGPYLPYPQLTNGHYFFFSKDKRINMSGILGYYALVEYRNYSKKQVEMFATGVDFSPSSK